MEIYGRKNKGISIFLLVLLLVATALISGGGVYFWNISEFSTTNNKVLNDQLSELDNKNKNLSAQIEELEKDKKALTEQIKTQNATSLGIREAIQNKADMVLHALKIKDMNTLAELVNPDKGVRFTPYANVNLQKDIVIIKADIPKMTTDTVKYLWGSFDGTGEPIDLTFNDYYKKFIYDADFLEAPQIVFNQQIQRGNSILNVAESYPDAVFIEYHFPGFDKKYGGMDWRSLLLVFEQKDGKWYLTGVVHNQWTI